MQLHKLPQNDEALLSLHLRPPPETKGRHLECLLPLSHAGMWTGGFFQTALLPYISALRGIAKEYQVFQGGAGEVPCNLHVKWIAIIHGLLLDASE